MNCRIVRRTAASLFLFFAMLLFPVLASVARAEDASLQCTYLSGTNVGYQNYSRWSKPVYSSLVSSGSGYMRVQGNVSGRGVTVAHYNSDFALTSRQDIGAELPLFGGFFESSSNYYLVTGQENPNEDNSLEVYRITKYDKSWNRLGSCGLYGANTVSPFDAGSCRMDMDGSRLVIRTCHTMYKSSDGYNHQASVMILVDTSSMTVVDSYTGVMNTSYGYVSHSFNQFVRVVNGKVVALDHGDAYPRGISLLEYPKSLSGTSPVSSGDVSCTRVMTFAGDVGNNTTGASVGAFEVSDSSYLVAGNAVAQDESFASYQTRNVFVACVNRGTKNVTINWLTSYAEGETTTTTPQMVSMGDGSYLVMWGHGNRVEYAFVNANGSATSGVFSFEGALSDCVPLVRNGQATWFSWDDGNETFYQVSRSNPQNPSVTKTVYGHDYQWGGTTDGVATLTCSRCGDTTTGAVPTSFSVYWRDAKSSSSYYYGSMPTGLEVGDRLLFMLSSVAYSSSMDTRYSDFTTEIDDPEAATIAGESITFRKAGTFTISVYPTYNPSCRIERQITIVKPLQGVALKSDATGALRYGDKIELAATADGGKGTLAYTFVAIDQAGTQTTIQASSTKNSCSWTPAAIGTYRLRVDVTDSASYDGNALSSEALNCEVLPADVEVKDGKSIEAVGSLTYGQRLSELAHKNATFVVKGTSTLVAGAFSYDDPNAMLQAGTHQVGWTFVPSNNNYAQATGTMSVQVEQAIPNISALPQADAMAYHPQRTLKDVPLKGGTASVEGSWQWVNGNVVPDVPGGTYACEFVPADSQNYRMVNAEVALLVTKATPYLASLSAEGIVYGQSLADATLRGGMQHAQSDSLPVEGSFVWTDTHVKPAVSDSDRTPYEVLFVPSDTGHYEQVETSATVTVAKASMPWTVPSQSISVPFSTSVLSDEVLAATPAWRFDASVAGTPLVVGQEAEFTAFYVGDDADCFEQTTMQIRVTRSACSHDGQTEVRGAVEPTCLSDGATGDTICLTCQEIIGTSTVIPRLEHDWDEGVVTEVPTCSLAGSRLHTCKRGCGTSYAEVLSKDSHNHVHVATTPAIPATMQDDGSTKAEVCEDCKEVLQASVRVPKVQSVELESTELTYSGLEQRPLVVALTDDNTELVENVDYELEYQNNVAAGQASVCVSGTGAYAFQKSFDFNIAPKPVTPKIVLGKASFVYNGLSQQPNVKVYDGSKLLTPGSDYALTMPAQSVDAKSYEVRVDLMGNYEGSGTATYKITKATPTISIKKTSVSLAKDKTVSAGASITPGAGTLSYKSSNTQIVKVDSSGRMTAVAPGKATITVLAKSNANFAAPTPKEVTVTVPKLAQPMVVKAKTATVKYASVKKAKQTLAASKVVAVSKAQGKLTYKKVSGSAKVTIASNGKVTVKKGLGKGTYKVKVKVSAAGNTAYMGGSKTVAFTIVVK